MFGRRFARGFAFSRTFGVARTSAGTSWNLNPRPNRFPNLRPNPRSNLRTDGTCHAETLSMCAWSYRELAAWQLAVRLRDETIAIIPLVPRPQDRKLFDQLRSSVDSPPDNIAEGSGRFAPVDFAGFLSIAIGSLDEADNQSRKSVGSGSLSSEKVAPLLVLTARCRRATLGLRRYLLGRGRSYVTHWKTRQKRP